MASRPGVETRRYGTRRAEFRGIDAKAPRLVERHKVLKPTGTLNLQRDPNASLRGRGVRATPAGDRFRVRV